MPAEHWALVLDLAVRWQLDTIPDLAVGRLTKINHHSSTLALQVATARRHKMDMWYWQTFFKMCECGSPISPEEAGQLGAQETARISAIRQKLHRARPTKDLSVFDRLQTISISAAQTEVIRTELGLPPLAADPPDFSDIDFDAMMRDLGPITLESMPPSMFD